MPATWTRYAEETTGRQSLRHTAVCLQTHRWSRLGTGLGAYLRGPLPFPTHCALLLLAICFPFKVPSAIFLASELPGEERQKPLAEGTGNWSHELWAISLEALFPLMVQLMVQSPRKYCLSNYLCSCFRNLESQCGGMSQKEEGSPGGWGRNHAVFLLSSNNPLILNLALSL